ncbi:MAG TPA: glycosyltransferase [Thermoanaerobaculia bacterium]|jgi:GT2 family glycosyltransferase|nr:glycosyltransferase [Thermoanaerobaculia bacterium]
MPSLSIVIPNLDSPWIGRTLAGIRTQWNLRPRHEVIVVGSDRPGQVPRDGSVRWIETAERVNPAAARNRGVAESKAEKILFIDSDCRPFPGWAERLAGVLDQAPIAGGAVTFPHGPEETSVWALADNIASFHELLSDRPAEVNTRRAIGSLNLAVRRDAWDRIDGFDEALTTSEDFDWVLRARKAGFATAFVPDAIVEHAAVRKDRAALEAHAAWYGSNFHLFKERHPETYGTGPTWSSPKLLAATAPLKAWTGALAIFAKHPELRGSLHALPGVVAFRRAWYQAVIAGWPRPTGPGKDVP